MGNRIIILMGNIHFSEG